MWNTNGTRSLNFVLFTMQNRQQMLASPSARATYTKFQRQSLAATVCRGTSDDDFNFFYSDLTYWADNCLGWVPDITGRSKVCVYCARTAPPEIKLETKSDINEVRKQSRNSNRAHRQPNEPSAPNAPGLRQLQKSRKHGSESSKGISNTKNKKTEEISVQKRNCRKERSKK